MVRSLPRWTISKSRQRPPRVVWRTTRPNAARRRTSRFAAADRDAFVLFLAEGLTGAGSPAPAYAARETIRRFNCLACHNRDGEGGLTVEIVEQLRKFQNAESAEAVLPPTLTGVGHKLRTPWMKQVLLNAGRARPWMSLRMPQFGDANVGALARTSRRAGRDAAR